MIDDRRPDPGQVLLIQRPPEGEKALPTHDYQVVDVRVGQALLEPVGSPPWSLEPGMPLIATFETERGHRRVDLLVLSVGPGNRATARLPDLPDRRQHRRFDAELPVTLEVACDAGKSEIVSCTTVDVSGGGVCVATDSPVESHAPVFLCISIPRQRNPIMALVQQVGSSQPTEGGYHTRLVFSTIADETRGKLLLHLNDFFG